MNFLLQQINPIVLREMRSRMRGRRAFIVLTVQAVLLSLLIGIVYATIYYEEVNRTYSAYNLTTMPIADHGPMLGKATFISTVLLLLAIFSFVAPAFGAGAIAGEKERQTYDTLLVTTLPGQQIVLGKLGAILTLLTLFLLISTPILSMAFWFGGIALIELGLALLGLLVSLFAFTAIGLYLSSLMRTTTLAVSLAYGLLIPILYLLPILIVFVTEGPWDDLFRYDNSLAELIYNYTIILLMSINPFFATILSGVAAAEGNGYFFYTDTTIGPIRGSQTLWLVSPWLVYVIFYTGLGIALVMMTIRRVSRVSRS